MQPILRNTNNGDLDSSLVDFFNKEGLTKKYRYGMLVFKNDPLRQKLEVRPNTLYWRWSWFIRTFLCALVFTAVTPLVRKLMNWELIKEAEDGFSISYGMLRERSSRLLLFPKKTKKWELPEIGMLTPYKWSKIPKTVSKPEKTVPEILEEINEYIAKDNEKREYAEAMDKDLLA